MRYITILTCAALALTGCSKGPTDSDGDGKISMREAASASAGMVKPEPGQYRSSVQITDVSMPGADAQMQEIMKQGMMTKPQVAEYCLKAEDVADGYKTMLTKEQGDCSFERYEASGGKLDAALTCKSPERGTAHMTYVGTFTSTSSDMTATSDVSGPEGQGIKTTIHMTQTRIGDCKA